MTVVGRKNKDHNMVINFKKRIIYFFNKGAINRVITESMTEQIVPEYILGKDKIFLKKKRWQNYELIYSAVTHLSRWLTNVAYIFLILKALSSF